MNEEERNKILEERKKWYSLIYVQFEIIKNLHHRELCFLSQKGEEKKYPVRYLLAFSRDYLLKHFERFGFLKNLINMYHSVATLKDVPVFSYNPRKRKEADEYKEFNENYSQYVTSYNLFFDFDGKEDFSKCFAEAKQLKGILDEFKVPYYVLNSSFNGFHFVVSAKFMPKKDIFELINEINNVAYNIKGIYDFKTLDISIIDLKRVQKCPYSYVCDGSICLPLNNLQFDNFKQSDVTMSNVLRNIKIKERGNLTRNLELGEEQLKLNVQKFINDFQ